MILDVVIILVVYLVSGSCAAHGGSGRGWDRGRGPREPWRLGAGAGAAPPAPPPAPAPAAVSVVVESARSPRGGTVHTDNFTYEFEVGEVVQLTCKLTTHSWSVRWTDSFGFNSQWVGGGDEVSLQVTADSVDSGLQLTCSAAPPAHPARPHHPPPPRAVSVLLQRGVSSGDESAAAGAVPKYLEAGEQWTDSGDCDYGMMLRPGTGVLSLFSPRTQEIITKFEQSLHGATYYCVRWSMDVDSHAADLAINSVYKYKRKQDKFVFYPKRGSTSVPAATSHNHHTLDLQHEGDTQEVQRELEGGGSAPDSNTDEGGAAPAAALWGGALAALLCGALLGGAGAALLWRRRAATAAPALSEARVIYSEIEERGGSGGGAPPSRRDLPPYARVVGTLAQPPRDKRPLPPPPAQNIYCTLK